MGMIKVRYFREVALKSGKKLYYWDLPVKYQASGMKCQRLSAELSQAMIDAQMLNTRLDAWRAGAEQEGVRRQGSIAWLCHSFQKDDKFRGVAPVTQREYLRYLNLLEKKWGHFHVTDVTRKSARAFYHSEQEKGAARAHAMMRCFRRLFNYAKDIALISENPFERMELKTPPARTQFWKDVDVSAFRKAAVDSGLRSMELAVMLGLYTGQRLSDILALPWSAYDGVNIVLRQGKTNAWVNIKVAGELKTLLDTAGRRGIQIIMSERTKAPYKKRHFHEVFETLRGKAGGMNQEVWFLDLRRTCAVNMARAGATEREISAVTGHKIETCRTILETYLPRMDEFAANAIVKLDNYKLGKQ